MLQSGTPMTEASAARDPFAQSASELEMRQLRHHTKNALQRITAMVAATPGLVATPAGRLVAEAVERRICLASQVSDALFGLTKAPGPLQTRLRALGAALVELTADPDQIIRLEVACAGECPPDQHTLVLKITQELIVNAVKHGLYARLVGSIDIRVSSGPRGTRLTVADDGWGHGPRPGAGDGLSLVRALLAPYAGTLTLRGQGGMTAEVLLPAGGPRPALRAGADLGAGRV